jgi:hypothetical protein
MTPEKPTLSVEQSMLMAWRHFHAGTREDAALIGLRVLQIEPKNPDALHLLGILAYQANRQEEALALLTEGDPWQQEICSDAWQFGVSEARCG